MPARTRQGRATPWCRACTGSVATMRTPNLLAAVVSSLAVSAPVALAAAPYAIVKGPEGEVRAPLFSPRYATLPVASVEGDPITLRKLSEALAATHQSRAGTASGPKKDFSSVLDRLIGGRLILLEAQEMGLDELPEFKADMAQAEEATLRRLVQERATRGVKPDPAPVERLFKDAVRQWTVRSVLFAKEEDAKAFSLAVRGGEPFGALAREEVAAKKAQGDLGLQRLSRKSNMLPQVRETLALMKKGESSRPVRVERGWAVL